MLHIGRQQWMEMDSRTAEDAMRREDLTGIRSLLERQCGSASVAEDLLSDALETSLRKLRAGEIARPEQLAGYVYRVALNHWRNLRRSEQAHRTTSAGLDALTTDEPGASLPLERAHWAKLMRDVLAELPTPRDRELIVAFYLEEEEKEAVCQRLGLSPEHFNRVIHRARERFRELIEKRGFRRGDFLSLAVALVG
jgi:RNA polymerase sigma-70 factor (ECF subfamily)